MGVVARSAPGVLDEVPVASVLLRVADEMNSVIIARRSVIEPECPCIVVDERCRDIERRHHADARVPVIARFRCVTPQSDAVSRPNCFLHEGDEIIKRHVEIVGVVPPIVADFIFHFLIIRFSLQGKHIDIVVQPQLEDVRKIFLRGHRLPVHRHHPGRRAYVVIEDRPYRGEGRIFVPEVRRLHRMEVFLHFMKHGDVIVERRLLRQSAVGAFRDDPVGFPDARDCIRLGALAEFRVAPFADVPSRLLDILPIDGVQLRQLHLAPRQAMNLRLEERRRREAPAHAGVPL